MTTTTPNRQPLGRIFVQGIWDRNAALIQLLGLCPLLAVTTTAVNGLALGLATLVVVAGSNALVSLVRGFIPHAVRIPAFITIIAALVTVVELLMAAHLHAVHQALGLFLPLIVTNCAILGRAEAFASRNPPLPALVDGVATGVGFGAVLVLLGAAREVVGQGTLLSGAEHLFGPGAAGWTLTVPLGYEGFLPALLPPGAFIGLALLLVLRNFLDQRGTRNPP